LSVPPRDWEWLAWFGVLPLFVAAVGQRPLIACGLGLIAGIACGATQGYISLPFLLLGLLLGGVAAVATWSRARAVGLRWVAFVACAGICAEWVTTLLPIPVHLALTQYRNLPVIQIAAFTGIWGISFLIWSVNAALADAFLRRRLTSWSILASFGCLGLAWAIGTLVLQNAKPRATVRVAAIQDRPEILASHGEWVSEPTDRHELTKRAAEAGARLVVWPELALGNTFDADRETDSTRALAKALRINIAVGYDNRVGKTRYNSAALLAPDGAVRGFHHKVHLWLDERGKDVGRDARAFDTDIGRLGLEICFDTCFTDVTRWSVQDGAQIIAMPNFDPPTPGGVLHRLHGAVLPFRAVENRVAFVRADWSGLSQIVDPWGRIIRQSDLGRAEALVADVSLGNGRGTWFTRLGDWPAWASLGAVVAFLVTSQRRAVQGEQDECARVESGAAANHNES
jgi:apolipoprotein N-acyltransferase